MLYLIPLVIAYFITLNWHFMYYYNFLLAYIILPIYAMESFQTRPSSGKRMHISLETEDFSFAPNNRDGFDSLFQRIQSASDDLSKEK